MGNAVSNINPQPLYKVGFSPIAPGEYTKNKVVLWKLTEMMDLFTSANDPRLQDGDGDQITRLLRVMAALRNPDGGCPWDLEQSSASIAQYAIEEAYELVDAIEHGLPDDVRDELGDVLLQVVFHSQMSREAGGFDIQDVARSICEKMLRRHPHVFDVPSSKTAAGVRMTWEEIKAQERADKASRLTAAGVSSSSPKSVLDDVPTTLPALRRSDKLQARAAKVGFDHPTMEQIYAKHLEELEEVKDAAANGSAEELELEVGDLLFTAAAIARRLGVAPEEAFRKANDKFERRFRAVEAMVGGDVAGTPLETLDAAWNTVKAQEKKAS